jgi:ABC-type multidrug transport system fused ATPase/permease subunit
MQTLLRMLRLVPGQRRRLFGVIFVNTALGLGTLAAPYFLKLVIDALVAVASGSADVASQSRSLLWALGLLLIARLFLAFCGYLQERMSDLLRLDTIIELRKRLFDHVVNLSIDYYETHKAGETIQRVTQSLYEFGSWLQGFAEDVLLRILTIIFSLGLITWVNPLAGGISIGLALFQLLWAMRKKQVTKDRRTRFLKQWEKVQGQITETVQNLTTLRSFGGESSAVAKHAEMAEELRGIRLSQHMTEWRYNIVSEVVEAFGLVAIFGIVAMAAVQGKATVGDILLIALYLQQALSNLRPMAFFIDITGELITTCERVLDLLDVKPTVVDAPNAKELKQLKSIEFRDVNFVYPGHENEVLKNVSFVLKPGQMLALVGPSGTGKTTIVKLLLRLYEATGGEILVNGQSITAYTQNSLRKHIGTVMQDVALFNDSFLDNVALAKPEASRAEIEKAVKQAHAQEFVERLPGRYDTIVGERGIKLSGGQKQRVAIARAILKEPDLIILDEATSALDSHNEREVQKGLGELLKGRMSVVIAHRLSTVKHAHEILVIEEGAIVERGTHEQLIEHGGTYDMLFKLQSGRL